MLLVEVEDTLYYCDAGLGDGLHEPLLCVPGETTQGPYTYKLERTRFDNGASGWNFTHDPKAEFVHRHGVRGADRGAAGLPGAARVDGDRTRSPGS